MPIVDVQTYKREKLQQFWKVQDTILTGRLCGPFSHFGGDRFFIRYVETTDGRKISYPDGREIELQVNELPQNYIIGGRYRFNWVPISNGGSDYLKIKLQRKPNFELVNRQMNNVPIKAVQINKMSQKQLQLFNELHDRKVSDLQTFMDEDYEGFWDSVVSKYPESAHFIYELLQNADDTHATEARFILKKNALVFVHNGTRHFNITDRKDKSVPLGDINAIVNIGHNNKNGINTIGKFGVGFKSVFQYTDAPEIYDDIFHFRIENYIVPTLIEHDFKGRKEGETLFFIPFKNPEEGYRNIKRRLEGLNSPILFLRYLRSVKWREEGELTYYEYTKSIDHILDDADHKISCDYITETRGESKRNLYMFRLNIEVSDNNIQPVYVGYYTKENGTLDTDTKRKVFCFFQTSVSFGMCFVSHAPFLTTDNRDGLLPDNETNKLLISELAKLAADSIVCLRDLGKARGKILLNENLFDIIPVKYASNNFDEDNSVQGENVDISTFYKEFTHILKTEDIVYTCSGEYHSIYSVLSTNLALRELISKDQLNELLKNNQETLLQNKQYACPKTWDFIKGSMSVPVRTYISETLKVSEFTDESLAKCLTSDFMSHQTDEWIGEFYSYLERLSKKNQAQFQIFLVRPIVEAKGGLWLAPFTEDGKEEVFFSYDDSDEGKDSEEYYHFISQDKAEKHRDFFERILHLSEPNIVDFINNVVAPHYTGANIDCNIAKKDFSILMNGYEGLKKDEDERKKKNPYSWQWDKRSADRQYNDIDDEDLVDSIVNNVLFKAKDGDFHSAPMLFEGNDNTRTYFKESSHHEFDIDFYCGENSTWSRDKVKSFIHALGINNNHPRILQKEYQIETKVITDSEVEAFECAVNSPEQSLIMWNSIIKDSDKFETYQPYCYTYNSNVRRYWNPTKIFQQLNSTPWIYIKNVDSPVCPAEITLDEFHSLGYKPCNKIEVSLDFGKYAREKEREQREQEKRQQEEDNAEIISTFHGNLSEAKKASRLLAAFGNDVSDSDIEEFRKWKSERDMSIDQSDNISLWALDDSDSRNDTDELPQYHTNVRDTLHYIGQKLYEEYLKKKNFAFVLSSNTDEDNGGYDIKVLPDKLVKVSVIKDKEIDQEKFAPIGITRSQHAYMNHSNTNRYTMIRIALGDLALDFDHDIRDLYGAEADVNTDEHFRKRCDKFVADYWKGKSVEDFEKMTSEYSIRIYREL